MIIEVRLNTFMETNEAIDRNLVLQHHCQWGEQNRPETAAKAVFILADVDATLLFTLHDSVIWTGLLQVVGCSHHNLRSVGVTDDCAGPLNNAMCTLADVFHCKHGGGAVRSCRVLKALLCIQKAKRKKTLTPSVFTLPLLCSRPHALIGHSSFSIIVGMKHARYCLQLRVNHLQGFHT